MIVSAALQAGRIYLHLCHETALSLVQPLRIRGPLYLEADIHMQLQLLVITCFYSMQQTLGIVVKTHSNQLLPVASRPGPSLSGSACCSQLCLSCAPSWMSKMCHHELPCWAVSKAASVLLSTTQHELMGCCPSATVWLSMLGKLNTSLMVRSII